jgi:hypothetical protein
MITFDWKITEIESSDNKLNHVKYYVKAQNGEKSVETEGYCFLKLQDEVSFADLLEVELIEYLKRFYIQDDVNLIESRLTEQLSYLEKTASTTPPWHIDTFKVEV